MSCLHRTLKVREGDRSFGFRCDGCQEMGYGTCYNCANECDYQLHVECQSASLEAPHFFEPHRSFFLKLQATPPNTGKLCEVCGMTVKGWRYESVLGCTMIHSSCMKPHSLVQDGVGELPVAKRLESISCLLGKCKSLGEHVGGWAIVSADRTVGFHIKCYKEKMFESWIEDMSCSHRTTKLIEYDDSFIFRCNGCEEIGDGRCYNCTNGCDYQLHEECQAASAVASHLFEPQRSFVLQLQATPNTTKLCEACGMSVKGWRYDSILGSTSIHTHCMKLPRSFKTDDVGEFSLTKRLESIACGFCKCKSQGEHLDGWAYVSADRTVGFHIKCYKELMSKKAIKEIRTNQDYFKERKALIEELVSSNSGIPSTPPDHNGIQHHHHHHYHYVDQQRDRPTSHKKSGLRKVGRATAGLLFSLATGNPVSAISAISDLL